MPSIGSRSLRRDRDTSRRSTLDPYTFSPSARQQSNTDGALEPPAEPALRAASEDASRPEPLGDMRRMSVHAENTGPPLLPTHPRHTPITTSSSRFNLLRFRNASEPQLGAKAREQANQAAPPVPAIPTQTPAIIMTAPTIDQNDQPEQPSLKRTRSKFHPFSRQRQANGPIVLEPAHGRPSGDSFKDKVEKKKSRFGNLRPGKDPVEELRKLAGSRASGEMLPANGPKASSSLALPLPRQSDSSRSDGDASEQGPPASDAPSPERPSPPRSHTAFAWLPRRNRNRNSLFPLPVRIPPPDERKDGNTPSTPRASTGARSSISPEHSPANSSPLRNDIPRTTRSTSDDITQFYPSTTLPAATVSFTSPAPLLRTGSVHSAQSSRSSPAAGMDMLRRGRLRSSTLGSSGALSDEARAPTPPFAAGPGSGRNSTSTAGRSSFSNLFALNRLRHGSDLSRQGSPGHGLSAPSGPGSHSNSLNLSREVVALPERQEGKTALQYLADVEEVVPKSQIPTLLSKSPDDFLHNVMRSFMRKFAFFGDPLDMAIRKLLLEIDLPKETQQIDRVLQGFADRYHECNPGIFATADNAYFIAFSILILQTDAFNKNNKRKMTKQDYVKNSSIEGVADDVLECFYDNILYTPFIRVEDDDDVKTMHSRRHKRPARSIKSVVPEPVRPKTSKEPLDPYTLIFESKLDTLRPPLKDVMNLEDPYSYLGSTSYVDNDLLKASKVGILQIESSRSRPDAFMSPSGIENPADAKVGIVELPVDKVGVLWRKDPKKKTARSPWQEWGAILCGAGLYFFKNNGWVKSLMHQYETHLRHGQHGTPCTFSPAIQQFKPDYMLPTDHGVALQDSTYRRHKHAFVFCRPSGSEEVFLADNEAEKNDWLAKLNQQAAFKTAGIRQRGLVGGNYDGQRTRGLRRLESSNSASTVQTVQTPTGEVTIQSGKIDQHLAQQISLARQESMRVKIEEAEEKLAVVIKQIDSLLRDARHLLLLAPIQSKTREQLVHAAGRMAAKLKWIRIELWRMKCHRDILAMDLEEEKREAQKRQARLDKIAAKANSITSQSSASTTKPVPNGIERLQSGTSSVPSPKRAPHSPNISVRPDTKSSDMSKGDLDDDVFRTPPENSPEGTPTKQTSAYEPLTLKVGANSRNSFRSTNTPRLAPPDAEEQSLASPSYSEYKTPILDDEEAARQREEGEFGTPSDTVDGATAAVKAEATTDSEVDTEKPLPLTGSPESRTKVRRSLQRTLRDGSSHRDSISSHHSYHRSRRSKNDSISSTVVEEGGTKTDGERPEGEVMLKREKGSFTVHGKKASVVTFGAEWANMSPEERLKLRKLAQAGSSNSTDNNLKALDRETAIIDDDGSAVKCSRSNSHAPRSSSFSSGLRDRQSSMSSASSLARTPAATLGARPHSSSFSNAEGSPTATRFFIPKYKSNASLRERRAARKASQQSLASPKAAKASDEPSTEQHNHGEPSAQESHANELQKVESSKDQAVQA